MKVTTLGQTLVNDALPSKFRDYSRMLTKGEADNILAQIAKEHPDLYKDISWKLMQLGREASFTEGSTLKLSDLQPVIDKTDLLNHVAKQEKQIRSSKSMTDEEKQQALETVYGEVQKLIVDQTYQAALAANNPFAIQVKSKSRGNPSQLAALLSTPSVYQDAQDHTIPVFIRKSYSEGLDPAEYWAATYGARKGVISSKFATRDAGALGKQFGVAVITSVVAGEDCGTPYGIPVNTEDRDNVGAVLARQAGKFPAGTVVTKEVMSELHHQKEDEIVVRSPITCSLPQGVCKHCAGIREDGRFPEIGYHLGLNASSALAERISQASLNQKHCLFEESQVLYSDWSHRAIKDVKVGDWIMGCTAKGKLFPVKVLRVFDNGPRECWRTSFIRNGAHHRAADRIVLESTLEHKLWAARRTSNQKDSGWNGVSRMLPVGTVSKYFYAVVPAGFTDSMDCAGFRRILQEFLGILPTFDLMVDHPDHMFVLANGLIVANSGGQRDPKGHIVYSGFDVVNNLAQIPKTFPHRAAVAEEAGTVDRIDEAPQGGWNVMINDVPHYVNADRPVVVKPGDNVEKGDQLSEGIVNPADVVRLKGLGEGRRYFAERFTQAFRDSDYEVNRRNVEVLAKSMIDHVNVNDPEGAGDYLPGDTISYSGMAHSYRPRSDATTLEPKHAMGMYLEQPALHYTIGTQVTNRMVERLKRHGVTSVLAHSQSPGFTPEMMGVTKVPAYTDDWMARLGSTYLESRLLEDVHTGAKSQLHSLNPLPGIAKGVEFGRAKGSKFSY